MRAMVRIIAGLALVTGPAWAADLPVAAPAYKAPAYAPVYNWTGCYVGGGGGYGMWTQGSFLTAGGVAVTAPQTNGGKGWFGQGQAGCDYQFTAPIFNVGVVIGAFGDYGADSLMGTSTIPGLVGSERESSTWAAGGRVVASFFVSRIDTAVDKLLDDKIRQANEPEQKAALERLKGRAAIANAKLAYQRYQRLFSGARWDALARDGGKAQRLLWASTGTKNKAYSDVLYVEELIGPNTVNTMPPATMDAFRDHGKARPTLEDGVDEARHVLTALDRAGISLAHVTDQLVVEGVQLFADAADKLLGAVAAKRAKWLGARLNQQNLALGRTLAEAAKTESEAWRAPGKGRLMWQHDASLWTGKTEAQWLGWLDIVDRELAQADVYATFAATFRQRGFTHAIVLGMGGSSLGPEVLAETFGRKQGFPQLLILNSTDPAQVRATEQRIDLAKALFIVSSKSGSTLEPNAFTDYFFTRVKDVIGEDKAGAHFVAVTDPGSSMEKRAKADKFWRIFHGVPSIGGRYSVLSAFGLVPAAASGIDVRRFLQATQVMVRSCGADVPPAANPGLQLGITLGCAAMREKRDKVTLVASPKLADFGAWAEQLIAEIDRQGRQGPDPDRRRAPRPSAALRQRPHFRPAAARVGRQRAGGCRTGRTGAGRSTGGPHRARVAGLAGPGILSLGDRDGGRRRHHRHQSIRPAGR